MKSEENIVGYNVDGTLITHEELIADIGLVLKQLEEGTLETYTTEEVRQMIFGDNLSL